MWSTILNPRRLVLGLTLGLAAGCRAPAPQTWSCNNPQRHACSEWRMADMDAQTLARQQASCGGMGGTVVQAGCPHADVVGTCTAAGSGEGTRIVYYAPRDQQDPRRMCQVLGGTWQQ